MLSKPADAESSNNQSQFVPRKKRRTQHLRLTKFRTQVKPECVSRRNYQYLGVVAVEGIVGASAVGASVAMALASSSGLNLPS